MEYSNKKTIDALVLAGKSSNMDLGIEYKPLLGINNTPMIKYVVDALHNSKHIKDIYIGGKPELKNIFQNYNPRVYVLQSKQNILDNVLMLAENAKTKDVFLITADLPLSKSENIDNFIQECKKEKYFDACISYFLRDEKYYSTFKNIKKSSSLKIPFLKIPEIKNGCVFMAKKNFLENIKQDKMLLGVSNMLYDKRKEKPNKYIKDIMKETNISYFDLAKSFLNSFFHINNPNFLEIIKSNAENLIKKKTGKIVLIKKCDSQLGIDVDRMHEAEMIEEILKKENKN